MTYVEAFVLGVKRDKLQEYKDSIARTASIWKQHGALSYVECVGDNLPYGEKTSFPRAVQAADDEAIILSWIIFPSREVRDTAMEKVMADPQMKAEMDTMPVDGSRMIYGSFIPIIES